MKRYMTVISYCQIITEPVIRLNSKALAVADILKENLTNTLKLIKITLLRPILFNWCHVIHYKCDMSWRRHKAAPTFLAKKALQWGVSSNVQCCSNFHTYYITETWIKHAHLYIQGTSCLRKGLKVISDWARGTFVICVFVLTFSITSMRIC